MRNFVAPSRLLSWMTAFALIGCTPGPAFQAGVPGSDFVLDRAALYESMARPEIVDWQDGRITTAEVDRLRQLPANAAAQRRLQALNASTSTALTTGSFGSGAFGRITSAPAFDFRRNRAYWLSDEGYVLACDINLSTGAPSNKVAWPVMLGGTRAKFARTSITVSNDGKRLYLCSLDGYFHAIDTTSGLAVVPPIFIGADAEVTTLTTPSPTMPAPFIDALASRDDGQEESVYAAANGKLHRFCVNARTVNPTTTITLAQSYALPLDTGTFKELLRSSPIVIRGKAVIGTWRKHTSDARLDTGALLYYDTGCTYANPSAVPAGSFGNYQKAGLVAPAWAAPAVEFDDSLRPVYAFVPTGMTVTMVELLTGTTGQAQSAALLVDKTTPLNGDLASYVYSVGAVVNKTVPVYTPGGVEGVATVSGDNTSLMTGTTAVPPTKDRVTFTAYESATASDNPVKPAYGYLRFDVANSDLYVAGETSPRAVWKAYVRLTCTRDSNTKGNTGVPPFRSFKVNEKLNDGSGNKWTYSAIAPASRPTFDDGAAFTFANLGSHKSKELGLPAAAGANGNIFKANGNGAVYDWDATAFVPGSGTYSFGFYTENTWDAAAKNPGKPFQVSVPTFGGTSNPPQLILQLASTGLQTPTMTTPVTIDSYTKRIYALNSNALFAISYQSFTAPNDYGTASIGERLANFADSSKTYFALTALGRNFLTSGGATGPIVNATTPKVYVNNVTAPLFTGNAVYCLDNYSNNSGYVATSLTKFALGTAWPNATTPGTPPSIVSTATDILDMRAKDTSAKAPGTYLVYDYRNTRLYASTYDPGNNSGLAWVVSQ